MNTILSKATVINDRMNEYKISVKYYLSSDSFTSIDLRVIITFIRLGTPLGWFFFCFFFFFFLFFFFILGNNLFKIL